MVVNKMKVLTRELYNKPENFENKKVELQGWVRNNRSQKKFGFLDFHDGSHQKTIQLVYEENTENFKKIQKIRVGSAIVVKGMLVMTPKMKQPFEVKCTSVELVGDSPEDYPIQPKRHSREFLRTVSHLRPRTNLFQAVFRIRSETKHAIHRFFDQKNFIHVDSPIITGNDGEGAGAMFSVGVPEKREMPTSNYENFFSTKTYLTVSGQLQAEAFALSLRNVYTFGPTFRAERSNTQKHASEFWMVEPEMAFCDIECAMKISEEMIKYVVGQVLENCMHEIDLLNAFVDNGLRKKLQELKNHTFKKITHKEAIDILINSKQKFDNEPNHAKDLNSEHEKYLTDVHFKCPVFIKDWPKNIKAFYMRENSDKKTVAAFDLLVSGGVELVGGSQREERMGMLKERMKSMNVKSEGLEWYLDLRKYGGVVHSGFGLGFDRLIMYLTSTENIRDVIPFPRTPNNCKY